MSGRPPTPAEAAAEAADRAHETALEAALSDWRRFSPAKAKEARVEALRAIVSTCGENMSEAARVINRRFGGESLGVTEGRIRQLLDGD